MPIQSAHRNKTPRSACLWAGAANLLIIMICDFLSCAAAARESGSMELAELARNAKGNVVLPKESDVHGAKQRLDAAVSRLDKYLTSAGTNGAAWKRYLLFDQLDSGLRAANQAKQATLAAVLARFRANYPGLERPLLQDVAEDLDTYLATLRQRTKPPTTAELDEKLDQLAAAMSAELPTGEQFAEIERTMGWLQTHGQSPNLVAAVRQHLSQPNLRLAISQEMISAGSLREINDLQPRPVCDMIMGTRIIGSGRTTGWARTRLLDDPRRALFETSIVATNRAQTVGYNGPARIYNESTTDLHGTKRFYVDETGIHAWSAVSRAEAHTRIRGIGSNKHRMMDRLVRRVASKRVSQQKPAAERIAARHAERQLNARLDAEANAQLGRAHASFLGKLRNPLLRLGQWPREVQLSSSGEQFRLLALYDAGTRLAAPTAAPRPPQDAALVVQVHESLVNNYGDGLFAGKSLRQEDLDRLSMELFGRRPRQLANDEQKGPWAITFGSHEPFVLRVDGGKASLTIRGRRFASEIRTIETPLDVTAHYRLMRENNAAKAVREGELEVYPAGFVADGKRKMSLRQSRDASYVRHRFDDFFTPEINSQGLIPSGQWGRIGRLDLIELKAEHGWITLAWQPAAANPTSMAETEVRDEPLR